MFQKLKHFDTGDTRFLQVKIWLMHLKDNLNGSYFSKEVVEKAIPTLNNTPILAYIENNSEDEKDFSDHRIVLIKEDGNYKIKYIGQAIGVIPESNNAKFELRLCDDGIEREFLTVEGLVWQNKWDDAPDILNRDVIKGQSMELHDDYIGKFEDDNLFHFSEFKFYGACALGKSVQPAMHNATIEVSKFSFDKFSKEIQNKMEQFKQFSKHYRVFENFNDYSSNNSFEGGQSIVGEKLNLLKKYNLTIENLDFSIEDISLEELELKISQKFSLSAEQFKSELIYEISSEQFEDRWGCKISKYLYVDHQEGIVFVYDRSENYKLYGFTYSTSGDKIIIDFNSKKRKKFIISDFEDGVSDIFVAYPQDAIDFAVKTKEKELESQFSLDKKELTMQFEKHLKETNANIEKDKNELERLRNFEFKTLAEKRNENEQCLFSTYKCLDGIEEFEQLKKDSVNLSIEELETKLALLFAKKNIDSLSTLNNPIKINFGTRIEEDYKPYGDLPEKYLK